MTVRIVGQASGTDTAESVRLALSLFQFPGTGVLDRRSGLVPVVGSADLTGVTPMVGRIAPFVAWVDGTSGSNQGGYPIIVDANVDLTFANGEAGNTRIDRVVCQVRDNTYDASGSTDARVRIVQGQAGGAANAVPASSILLWEVTVPAGATVGGGGFTMSTARADKRPWTSGHGGMLPIKDAADLATLTAPYAGMQVFRLDAAEPMIYRGGGWAWSGVQRTARKSANETVTSSTTYQDDDHLFLTGLPATSYLAFELYLKYTAHASADIKTQFTVPTNGAIEYGVIGKSGTAQANGSSGTPDFAALFAGSTPRLGGWQNDNASHMFAYIMGTLYTGDGGSLTLQWAQDTSNATGTIVLASSRLTGRLVL